jgi:NagD protein
MKAGIQMKKIDEIECFVLDMDGTFYLGNKLINGALDFLAKVKEKNKNYIFLTNNSSRSSRDYQKKLKSLGVKVPLKYIINSGQVTASYIKNKKNRAKIYVVGTPSLEKELQSFGLRIIKDKNKDIDYLVLGFDTTLTYKKLHAAHDLILKVIPYIATNPDYVCPLAKGKTMPDCGSIISLLKTSTGKEPLVIGKPNILMIDYVASKLEVKKENIAMIGDRLYTDIQTANNADITSILVLSGETNKNMIENAPQDPDYIFQGIKELEKRL